MANCLSAAALLDTEQAAEFLRVSPKSLANWRTRREGPPYVLVGRLPRYQPETLRKWLAAHAVRPASANDGADAR